MMTEIISAIIEELNRLAQQIYGLATGLKNVAPVGTPGQSVQYLLEAAAQITQISGEIEQLLETSQQKEEFYTQLLQSVRALLNNDEALRKKYEIDNKFRFVREQLQLLLKNVEQKEPDLTVKADRNEVGTGLRENEMAVHVHLYNAKGIVLSSWYNMLTPNVFFEYSVNRPIYAERLQIENLLKSKNNKIQHAYLIVAVNAVDILQSDSGLKDSLGCSLIKIKEGSLSFDRLLAFVYNDQEYILNEKGELIKKTS